MEPFLTRKVCNPLEKNICRYEEMYRNRQGLCPKIVKKDVAFLDALVAEDGRDRFDHERAAAEKGLFPGLVVERFIS